MGNADFLEFKKDIKDDIVELKDIIEKSNESTNQALQKLSDILQEFQLLVAKNYIDKEDLYKYQETQEGKIQEINAKIDNHIKESQENKWKLIGVLIGVPAFLVSTFEFIKTFYKG